MAGNNRFTESLEMSTRKIELLRELVESFKGTVQAFSSVLTGADSSIQRASRHASDFGGTPGPGVVIPISEGLGSRGDSTTAEAARAAAARRDATVNQANRSRNAIPSPTNFTDLSYTSGYSHMDFIRGSLNVPGQITNQFGRANPPPRPFDRLMPFSDMDRSNAFAAGGNLLSQGDVLRISRSAPDALAAAQQAQKAFSGSAIPGHQGAATTLEGLIRDLKISMDSLTEAQREAEKAVNKNNVALQQATLDKARENQQIQQHIKDLTSRTMPPEPPGGGSGLIGKIMTGAKMFGQIGMAISAGATAASYYTDNQIAISEAPSRIAAARAASQNVAGQMFMMGNDRTSLAGLLMSPEFGLTAEAQRQTRIIEANKRFKGEFSANPLSAFGDNPDPYVIAGGGGMWRRNILPSMAGLAGFLAGGLVGNIPGAIAGGAAAYGAARYALSPNEELLKTANAQIAADSQKTNLQNLQNLIDSDFKTKMGLEQFQDITTATYAGGRLLGGRRFNGLNLLSDRAGTSALIGETGYSAAEFTGAANELGLYARGSNDIMRSNVRQIRGLEFRGLGNQQQFQGILSGMERVGGGANNVDTLMKAVERGVSLGFNDSRLMQELLNSSNMIAENTKSANTNSISNSMAVLSSMMSKDRNSPDTAGIAAATRGLSQFAEVTGQTGGLMGGLKAYALRGTPLYERNAIAGMSAPVMQGNIEALRGKSLADLPFELQMLVKARGGDPAKAQEALARELERIDAQTTGTFERMSGIVGGGRHRLTSRMSPNEREALTYRNALAQQGTRGFEYGMTSELDQQLRNKEITREQYIQSTETFKRQQAESKNQYGKDQAAANAQVGIFQAGGQGLDALKPLLNKMNISLDQLIATLINTRNASPIVQADNKVTSTGGAKQVVDLSRGDNPGTPLYVQMVGSGTPPPSWDSSPSISRDPDIQSSK